jgi:hypothetical protein
MEALNKKKKLEKSANFMRGFFKKAPPKVPPVVPTPPLIRPFVPAPASPPDSARALSPQCGT